MAINNYSQSWNDHSGDEVLNFINSKLQSNENNITLLRQNAITDISFEQDSESSSTINYSYIKNGQQVTGSFQTTVLSSFNTILNVDYDNIPEAIALGLDFTIRYSCIVTDSGTPRAMRVYLQYTINGRLYDEFLSPSTTSATNTPKMWTLSIPSELLASGNNIITLNAYAKPTQDSMTNVSSAQIGVYCLQMSLDVTLSGATNYTVSDDDPLTLDINVTNNDLTILVVEPSNIYYHILLDKSTDINYGPLGSGYHASYQNTLRLISNLNSNYNFGGTVSFCVYATTTLNSRTIKSNYVYIQLVRTDNTSRDAGIGYKINNFSYLDGQSLNLNVTQYDVQSVLFWIYAKKPLTYTLTMLNTATDEESIIATALTDNSAIETVKVIELTWPYNNTGSYEYLLSLIDQDSSQENNTFFVVNIAELVTALKMPNDYSVNLLSLSKNVDSQDATWNINSNTLCTFNNFNWTGNGWKNTDKGVALLINDGAELIIPYPVCNSSNAKSSFTISFKYRIENGVDENESLISCLSNSVGFDIYPNVINFGVGNINKLAIDLTDVHEVTLVYYGESVVDTSLNTPYDNLCIIYVDGKYLAIFKADNQIYKHTRNITITSDIANIYLYSVIAYNKALSFTLVLSLYCFNNLSSSDIANYIQLNTVFGSTNTTNIGLYGQSFTIDDVPEGKAYMVLECKYDVWNIINGYIKNEANKKTRHYLESAALYVKGADGSAAQNRNFYADKAVLSALGTSSMDYPIKNYRLYFNKKADYSGNAEFYDKGKTENFFHGVREGEIPSGVGDSIKAYRMFDALYGDNEYNYPSAYSERLCLKADYAESSSSHNTGFARMANDVLKNSSVLTNTIIIPTPETGNLPLQEALIRADQNGGDFYSNDIRSNIDGRPIYLFFKYTGPNDAENNLTTNSYIYAGRYNMNNDKSNQYVFGFTESDALENILLDYYKNEIVRREGKWLQNTYISLDPNYAATHDANEDDEFINPTECWEFSANEHTGSTASSIVGAFTYPFPDAFNTLVDNLYLWLKEVWEYRFPNLEDDSEGNISYVNGTSKPVLLYKLYEWLYTNNYARTKNQNRLNTFASQLHLYFNVNYLLKYFVLTHWFAAVDLRIKNSMLSFYCDPYGVSALDAAQSPLHYMRGYFIFYDNDTILGINNNGSMFNPNGTPCVPWYLLEEDSGSFPGNPYHAIWCNLQTCYNLYIGGELQENDAVNLLGKLVAEAYRSIRAELSMQTIANYFNTHIKYYPDAVLNIDAELKYIYPYQLNKSASSLLYLEKAHGTMEYFQKYWLSNRTMWLDDKFEAGDVSKYIIKIKPLAVGSDAANVYGTIKVRPTSFFRNWRFYCSTDATSGKTRLLTNNEIGTLTYLNQSNSANLNIYGLYGCEELDLSECYFGTGIDTITAPDGIETNLPYLKKLIFGSDLNLSISSGELNDLIKSKAFPSLEYLKILNLTENYSLDLSLSYKLKTLIFNNVNLNSLTLPNSSALETLTLSCPTTLVLKNKTNLTSFTISNQLNLGSVTIENCSSQVYSILLQYFATRSLTSNVTLNIKFGINNNAYTIPLSSNEIDYLIAIGQDDNITKNVTGQIYASQITTELLSMLKEYYPSLIVSTSISGEILLLADYNNIYEGDTIKVITVNGILPSKDEWKLFVDNTSTPIVNNIHEYIRLESVNAGSCTITASLKDDNADHTFTVYAGFMGSDGQYILSDAIYVHYIGVKSIKLNSNSLYVASENTIPVTILLNAQCTKLFRFTNENITFTGSELYSYVYNLDNNIIGINVNKDNNQYTTLTLSAFGITSNSLVIERDEIVYNQTTSNSLQSSLYWLYLYLDAAYGIYAHDQYSKSDLNNITFSWDNFSKFSGTLNAVDVADQDYSLFKYFKWNDTTFNLNNKNLRFTELEVPEGMTSLIWLDSSVQDTRKGIIKLPSTLKRALVDLTINYTVVTGAKVPKMQFDLSNNGYIKYIYNTLISLLSSIEDGVFSLHVKRSVETANNSEAYNTERPLFIYNNQITYELIGNINNNNGDSLTENLPAMFEFYISSIAPGENINYSNSSDPGKAVNPFYYFGSPIVKTIGYFTTYIYDLYDPITISANTKKIYRTFFRRKLYSGLDLSGIVEIGAMTFGNINKTNTNPLTISNTTNLKKIGFAAFYNYQGLLSRGEYGFDLSSVEEIGKWAFRFASCSLITLSFVNHNLSIDYEAFSNIGESNLPEIHLVGTDPSKLTVSGNAFDSFTGYNAPTIYVDNAAVQSKLLLLNNSWNVQIYS